MLAGCGARLVLAGTAGPGEAAAIDLGLAGLRGAGADVSYVPADLSDPDEAETAIASVEQRVGPVTAIVHAASTGPLRECAGLSGDDLGAQIARQADGLSNVLGAVSAAGCGSWSPWARSPARYGAAAELRLRPGRLRAGRAGPAAAAQPARLPDPARGLALARRRRPDPGG